MFHISLQYFNCNCLFYEYYWRVFRQLILFILYADSAKGLQNDGRFMDLPRWSKKNMGLCRGV